MAQPLSQNYRGRLAEKVMDWGNLVFVGLVITQAFSTRFDFTLAFTGAAIFAAAYFVGYRIMNGGGK